MRFSIKTYIIIFVIIVSIGKLTCSIDSLLTQLDKVENNERIQTLFDLAYEYYNQNQYEKSKEYADKALLLSKRTENNLYTADILYFLGVHNNVLITNQEALEALWQALDIYEVHKKENDLAWTYNQIGVVYEELKINEKALIYYNKAQNIFEKLKDEISLGGIYNNLGNMYSEMNDEDAALQSYNISVEVNKRFGNLEWAAASLYNISIIYSSQEKFKLSVRYLKESYELYESIQDTASYFTVFTSLADNYAELGQFDSAYVYLKKAENLVDKTQYQNPELELSYQRGFIYLKQERYSDALSEFLAAEQKAKEIQDKEILTIISKNIGECYSGLELFESAYDYTMKYIAYEDSLKELEKTALLIQKQKEYEMERFQDQLQLEREKEKIKSRSKILQARLVGLLLLFVVIILILAIYLFYRNSRLQQKNNLILKESNENKNKLISILSHDMKNSLHSIKSGTRILSEEIDRLEKDDIKMFTRELSKSTENVYGFMENILLWMKSQADRLDVVEQDIAIHYMVSKIFELLSPAATQKNIHLINNTAEDDNVTADKDMLEFILRNLIQNAIKYSNKDGSVTVKSWRENNQLKISVSDNGIGIPEENLRTLFNSSNRFSRKGTSNEKGTGLGLVICNEFANRMDGSILCQSKEEGDDKGSVFTLILSDR